MRIPGIKENELRNFIIIASIIAAAIFLAMFFAVSAMVPPEGQ